LNVNESLYCNIKLYNWIFVEKIDIKGIETVIIYHRSFNRNLVKNLTKDKQ